MRRPCDGPRHRGDPRSRWPCTGGDRPEGDQRGQRRRRRPASCAGTTAPQTIEATFLSRHRCGTLVVPQDRSDGTAQSLDLAVMQVWPVGVEPREGMMTGFATNLGDPRVFGGNMAAGATRLGSVVVELAFRGTRPSSPSLACPEVDALAVEAPGPAGRRPGTAGPVPRACQRAPLASATTASSRELRHRGGRGRP